MHVHSRVLPPEQLLAMLSIFRKFRRVIELPIQGQSMGTTIAHGARIRIQCDATLSLRPGQVVAFLVGNRLIVHRVVYCGRYGHARHYLITQGDGAWLPDRPVPLAAVVGPVLAVQAGETWQSLGMQTPWAWPRRLLAILIGVLTGVALECHVALAQRLGLTFRLLQAGLTKSKAWLASRMSAGPQR
jgi:hypothetical protein